MKYQIKIHKERKPRTRNGTQRIPPGRKVKSVIDQLILSPHLSIKEVEYWQKRAEELLPFHHVTCVVK